MIRLFKRTFHSLGLRSGRRIWVFDCPQIINLADGEIARTYGAPERLEVVEDISVAIDKSNGDIML